MLKDLFTLAFKNLKHRGVRSWLTLLGIFIGVTAVVALISLGNGLQLAVSSQFGVSQTEIISVQAGGVSGAGPPGVGVVNPLTSKEFEAIEKLSSVKNAVKRYIASGKLEYNDKVVFGYATSIPDGEDMDFIYEQLEKEPVAGRFLKDGERGKVFLGYNFYVDKVGLGKEIILGKSVLINDKKFEVVGILDKKGSFIFDNAVYMNEEDVLELFDYNDKIDVIAVQPTSKDELDRTKLDVEKTLRKVRNVDIGEEDFQVSTPEASLGQIKSILTGVQIFIVFVASISIFIGAIGIVNTMTTSVLERKKEIGIMKSIGARNSHIFLQFFIESGLLGLLGGFVGIVFGTLIGIAGIYGINNFIGGELKPSIDFALIFFALLGSFLVGGVAGIVPAMRAAKQNPVEALRG
jgi:putative ABC transport system permease protein